ncbi:hypothetical protein CCYA_CCYA16G4148 [Cyanidiococcus yangmingshanensis]|nr:hypothetical protein CCYA_CCYA16G4148 [Cyanidiococcus yangmingshanensis]
MRVSLPTRSFPSNVQGRKVCSAYGSLALTNTRLFEKLRKLHFFDHCSSRLSMAASGPPEILKVGKLSHSLSNWHVSHTIIVRDKNLSGEPKIGLDAVLGEQFDSILLELDCADASKTYLCENAEMRRAIEIERGRLATDIESHFISQWEWSGAKHLHANSAGGRSQNVNAPSIEQTLGKRPLWLQITPECLFEDDDWIAFSKPAGVLSSTVLYMAMAGKTSEERERAQSWRLVNRLDRDTSGVLLFGKTNAANQSWNALVLQRQGSVEKYYLAELRQREEMDVDCIAESRCRFEAGHVIRVISGHGTTTRGLHRLYPLELVGERLHPRMRRPVRIAETLFYVLSRARLEPKDVTFSTETRTSNEILRVLCAPVTGRTHQIRLHAHAMGTPVFGDARYGVLDTVPEAPFHHLHALSLTMRASGGKTISINAETPHWW